MTERRITPPGPRLLTPFFATATVVWAAVFILRPDHDLVFLVDCLLFLTLLIERVTRPGPQRRRSTSAADPTPEHPADSDPHQGR